MKPVKSYSQSTLKLSLDSEVRRIAIEIPVSYSQLEMHARNLFPRLTRAPIGSITFHWIDDENDRVVISSDSEVEEACRTMSADQKGYIRFEVSLNEADVRNETTLTDNSSTADQRRSVCSECGQATTACVRYNCSVRSDYQLCATCEKKHPQPYPMIKMYELSDSNESFTNTQVSSHGNDCTGNSLSTLLAVNWASGLQDFPSCDAHQERRENSERPGSTTPPPHHKHIRCVVCGVKPIVGARYTCTVRRNYHLCAACEAKVPNQEHPMIKVYSPEQTNAPMSTSIDGTYGGGTDSGYSSETYQPSEVLGQIEKGLLCDSPVDEVREQCAGFYRKSSATEEDEEDIVVIPDNDSLDRKAHGMGLSVESMSIHDVSTSPYRHQQQASVPSVSPISNVSTAHTSSSYIVDSKVDAEIICDATLPEDGTLCPNGRFVKIWTLRNVGTVGWPAGSELADAGGDVLFSGSELRVSLPPIPVGGKCDVSVPLQAPATPGKYMAYFRMHTPEMRWFGPPLLVKVWIPSVYDGGSDKADTGNIESEGLQTRHEKRSECDRPLHDNLLWTNELDLLADMGFVDDDKIIPLLKKYVVSPSDGGESRVHSKGLEEVVSILIRNSSA
mmetsp:Transcript_10427/g.15864  ORF Transcript_10427/g.15864 Transcript_10427/m.15864 type:complete len:616 (-) Transcript_10427:212-2059(-)|eukprot:CAMPEP_0185018510 /NCGR_PEP_ID=MMETSP1103-20130426/1209_1 /TAXON_ID=36769 /ORGANISM="Paraphysomonas bandaiensis, Strain Caron Lab Isolate" /LENGTH=615 /DNA_ID=CAMNT_0027548347 /DNA_START=62 /DNA_END=1909 /DNA_ORIENTATION=-